MNGIKILGTGRGVPSKLVTNEDMAKIVDTNDEWITSRTGITHRHHLAEGETITDMTVLAARRALENAGISADQIGACIVATLTPDTLVPSAACCMQHELNLPHDTVCFDLNAACTGFLYALHTMECLLNASERKYGLVIGAERSPSVASPISSPTGRTSISPTAPTGTPESGTETSGCFWCRPWPGRSGYLMWSPWRRTAWRKTRPGTASGPTTGSGTCV